MASFLVVYGTGEGQTAKVADRIVEALADRGHDATAVDVADEPDPDVTAFDSVVLHCGLFYAPDAASTREFGERLAAGRLPVAGGLLGRQDATLSMVHADDAVPWPR